MPEPVNAITCYICTEKQGLTKRKERGHGGSVVLVCEGHKHLTNEITCSFCSSRSIYEGVEQTGKPLKYACEKHKDRLTLVVAELSPSRKKPTEQANQAVQEGMF